MQALILAGGKGTRLLPYTAKVPKPLMPIGDMPILEILIKQLKNQGFDSILLAVGYLNHMIEAYFGDGSKYGIKIKYSLEKKPLGTAGPIGLLIDELEEDFIVLNGDLLTDVSFSKIFVEHKKKKADATISSYQREVNVDFGVLEINKESLLQDYKEKPVLDYLVSMGINVFNKNSIIKLIKPNEYLDIPDLMMLLIKNKQKVFCFSQKCEWLDIGRVEDYSRAVKSFEKNKKIYLP
tara:strand:+ start:4816 stop:5526 length:711 start_codon:yes stop_codon:yes gene_type:complete